MKKLMILLLYLLPVLSYGQNDVGVGPYENALLHFENGEFEEALDTLEKLELNKKVFRVAIINLFAVKIYELKAACYLELNEWDKAVTDYGKILQLSPWYIPQSNSTLTAITTEYEVKKNWIYEFNATVNFSGHTRVDQNYSLPGVVELSEEYKEKLGFSAQLLSGKSLGNGRGELLAGLGYRSFRYDFVGNYEQVKNINDDEDQGILSVRESQDWITLPIRAKYHFLSVKGQNNIFPNKNTEYKAYLALGAEIHYLVDSKLESPFILFVGPPPTSRGTFDTDLPIPKMRNRWNYNVHLGLGADVPLFRVLGNEVHSYYEIGYDLQLQSVVNGSGRFYNQTLTDRFYYLDNDFRMGLFYVKFGIHFLNYKVSRK